MRLRWFFSVCAAFWMVLLMSSTSWWTAMQNNPTAKRGIHRVDAVSMRQRIQGQQVGSTESSVSREPPTDVHLSTGVLLMNSTSPHS